MNHALGVVRGVAAQRGIPRKASGIRLGWPRLGAQQALSGAQRALSGAQGRC
ncbi:hypothetical protein [Chondromyces crocatus]|uniref:hypothetical protein n=1 Tax=Chondromyces crocatus TaxID=52 RepID=UPI0012E17C13|nr:hypothetical protein [Chondromyces crocatus]